MPDTDTAIATFTRPRQSAGRTDWENIDAKIAFDRPTTPKDWEPLRALARKRAYVTLTKVWEDTVAGKTIWRANYRRFCYRDYKRGSFSIIETPYSISFTHQGPGGEKGSWTTRFHYCISFKKNRIAFYSRLNGRVRQQQPRKINLLPVIRDVVYPEAEARFERRLVKMTRSKARANGIRLPEGERIHEILFDVLYPGLRAVKEQYKLLKGIEFVLSQGAADRWLLRHLHCPPSSIVKSVTGYNSRVVTRLFWESLKMVNNVPSSRGDWLLKWCWLSLLRTWLPVDYSQAILRADRIADWAMEATADPAKVRKFLKQWTPQQIVRALTGTAADSPMISDTLRMLDCRENRPALPPLPKTNGPRELHDWLARERNRLWERERQEHETQRLADMTEEQRAAEAERKRLEKAPFKHSKRLLEVVGRTVETPDGLTHTIILPKDSDELGLWGSTLHNCIGSYGWRARSKEGAVIGLRTEGPAGEGRPVHWGIELVEERIVQFRGTCNKDAPDEIRDAVSKELEAAGLVRELQHSADRVHAIF